MLQRPPGGQPAGYEPRYPRERGEAPAGFDIREALNFAWRRWKLILGVAALAVLAAAFYISRQTPRYTASVQLLLEPNQTAPMSQYPVTPDMLLDVMAIESQIDVIESTALLRRVVVKEKLTEDPEFGASPVAPHSGMLGGLKRIFDRQHTSPPPSPDSVGDHLGDEEDDLDSLPPEVSSTIDRLKGAIKVTRSGQALVLNISLTSADSNKAARLANAVADAYVVDKLDAHYEAAKRASTWLNDRLVELRKQLHDSEEAVAQFRAANNLAQAGTGVTLTQEQLAQMNGRLVTARAETAEKKTLFDQLQKAQANTTDISALPEAMNDPTIADLRKQKNDLSRQVADLRTHYSDRYPAVVNLRAQLSDIHRAIDTEIARLTKSIKDQYQFALARQQAVEKTLKDVRDENNLDNTKAITLRELERSAAVNKTLFEDFLQRAKITQAQSTFEAREARVISPARPPGAPSSPRTTLIMLASAVLGLMGGVGCAFLIELLNAGFTTPRQVEEMLDLPLLASISKMETRDLIADGSALSMVQCPLVKPLSRFSEAIRSLRSAIQMSDVDNPPQVILVTSAIPGEGKSTICMTMASSAAQSGLRVLLIDCDLRSPAASHFFKLDKSPGLVDYLVSGLDLQKVVTFNEDLRLWLLPAGAKTQNPPDLLGSEKMKALIEALRTKFDLIILDTPPMGPVMDPLIVSNLVDKVVFVVRWATTAREAVAYSIKRLQGDKKVAGVVFNYVIDTQAQKYSGYAYSHYGSRYYKEYYRE